MVKGSKRDSGGGALRMAPMASVLQDHNDGRSGNDRCFDVFIIALNQTTQKNGDTNSRWYTPTANLQIASLQLCIACRKVISAHVRVDYGTPHTLLVPADEEPTPIIPYTREWFACGGNIDNLNPPTHSRRNSGPGGDVVSRIPVLRIRGVTWQQSPETLRYCGLLRHVEYLIFDAYGYDEVLEYVVWPPKLKKLVLGGSFSRRVDWLSWPSRLEELTFRGNGFDRPIDRARWPATLLRLTFGIGFNQPIEKVVWPPALRQLTFGHRFNQEIERVTWRAAFNSLTHLTFGTDFNQAVNVNVRWPANLQSLTFGDSFNQAIFRVVWPDTLRSLEFGKRFNQPIHDVRWPASLRELSFGSGFDQRVDEAEWPPFLEHLTVLCTGKRFSGSLRIGVCWPIGLQKLTVDYQLGLGFVSLPAGVEICRQERQISSSGPAFA